MTTEMSDAPNGELFTRVYVPRGHPVVDSETLRRRIGAYLQHELYSDHGELSVYLKKEAGIAPTTAYKPRSLYHKYEEFSERLPRETFLNAITLVWRFLYEKHKNFKQTLTKSGNATDKVNLRIRACECVAGFCCQGV